MLKNKLLWAVFALILAACTLFTLSPASAAGQPASPGSTLIGHLDSNGHLVLNPGVQLPANVSSPQSTRLPCSNPAYLKLYTDNGRDIICFGGKGYSGGLNIWNTGDIYTGNNNTTIFWDTCTSIPCKNANFYTYNLKTLYTDYPAWVISSGHFAFLPHISGIVIN